MRVIVDDGVALATVVAGPTDAPGLLLVHGFGGAKEDFADHFDALARDHRVVTFDHRGHGESEAPGDPAAYSLDRMAGDTLAVAEATGLADLRLLGHSMGGMVARRVALTRPERLAALILMDTSAGPPPGLDPELIAFGVEIVKEHGMGELKRVQDELDPLGSPSYRRLLVERPGYREYAERKWASLSAAMWMRLAVEIVTQPDELSDLARVALPTLVIVGDEDATFLEPSRQMAATVPGAELAVIPTAGHSPQFENPAAWFAALHDFLADLPALPRRPALPRTGVVHPG
ncbi:MAG: 3-oxoadipate enol-lactonase [Actinomycetota bacterium]|nr:3-oxoadipate enol-lactonase [Actinomycetota bacterium]